ncbi:hypothetical protein J3F84DRAFT_191882 [Trichoderma pleuroticola]
MDRARKGDCVLTVTIQQISLGVLLGPLVFMTRLKAKEGNGDQFILPLLITLFFPPSFLVFFYCYLLVLCCTTLLMIQLRSLRSLDLLSLPFNRSEPTNQKQAVGLSRPVNSRSLSDMPSLSGFHFHF